jgi:zinc D-Ala-D-Ala carboxypeptidase
MERQDGSVFDQGSFEQGLVLDEILKVLAPPGYSELHRGSAIDVGSSDCLPLDEQFETMSAYRWLFI